MSNHNVAFLLAVTCLVLAGCITSSSQISVPSAVTRDERKVPRLRKHTETQIRILQEFAIKESPTMWHAIQSMRAEISTTSAKLEQLRAEFLEFDRDPYADEGYMSLESGLNELRFAYDALLDRLEDAYIASKKFEASPSRKDYQEIMKRALENGIRDATMATERYKAMSRQK